MSRIASSLAFVVVAAAGPAFAADWSEGAGEFDGFRGTYSNEPRDWSDYGDTDDSLHFETGLRYWYSMGTSTYETNGSGSDATDRTQAAELHLRIDDNASATYAKAVAGYSIAVSGEYVGPLISSSIVDGEMGYAGADFGWSAFNDGNGSGFGGLVGYMFWNNSPDTGRNNYTTVDTGDSVYYNPTSGQTVIPGASAANHVEANMFRLGVQGKAKFNDFFDIQGELAAVPYAKVNGVMGVDDPVFSQAVYSGQAQLPYSGETGNISQMRSSITNIDGWAYGAMAEAFVGIHPTENLTFRLGGRAWYLTGTADATYSIATITDPGKTDVNGNYDVAPTVNNANFITTNNPFSMLRTGILAEFTYAF